MTLYTGNAKVLAKIWQAVGQRQIGQLQAGQSFKGDAILASGHMHLTEANKKPINGVARLSDLNYTKLPPPSTDLPPTMDMTQSYFVGHDYQLAENLYESRNGAPTPEVNMLVPRVYAPMNEKWQWFLFDLLNRETTALGTYNNKTAFMNGASNGIDQMRNYITGERMNMELPALGAFTCGGAYIRGEETTYKQVKCLKVATLDGKMDPPVICGPAGKNPEIETWAAANRNLWFLATIITDRKEGIDPFTGFQSYGVDKFPRGSFIRVPIVARNPTVEPVYIPMSKLIKLALGTPPPNPWNPAR